jgi:ABC-type branched-subunit amino acid transport system substrate-binding protein
MKSTRRHSIIAGTALALGAAFAAAGWTTQAQAQTGPIRVGFLSSFQGPANQSGFNGLAGVKMAVKEINEKGGVMGRQIEIIQGDDASDPTQGVNEARRLVQRERVQFLIGPIASQITLAVAPVLNDAKIGSISVTGSTAMTPQAGPYHFSMLSSSDIQAEFISQYLAQVTKAKSVAIIHDAGAQTRATVEAMRKDLPGRGVTIAGVETYELTATDMTPQLLSLRRTNPDTLVLLTGTGADTGYILKNKQEIGWDIRVVGNTTIIAQPGVTAKIAGPNGYRNAAGVNYLSQTYCTSDPVGQGDYPKFKERLQAFDPANYPKFSPLVVAYTYDAVYAMKAAMEGAKSTEGPAIAAWLEANAGKVKVTNGNLSASKNSHFLLGVSTLTMATDPDKPRADGLMKRQGC